MRVGVWSALAAVLAVSGLVSVLARSGTAPPELKLQQTAATCQQPPAFRVAYQEGEGAVQLGGGGLTFRGVGVVEGVTCGPGVLEVTGRGDVADGAAPRLEVSLNGRVLGRFPFAGSRTLRVALPQGGQVSLGYFNDFYKADVRIAVLEEVALAAPQCEGRFEVEVGQNSAGSWFPQDAVAYLVSDPGSILTPCAAGVLSVAAWGKPGGGAYPTVEFVQRGRVLDVVQTSARRQKVEIEVSDAPLTIRIRDPYARLLGDRNLYVTGWRFRPDERP
ncbi:MAG: hypothetical protein AB1511_03070 [Deinococcota bacterium]